MQYGSLFLSKWAICENNDTSIALSKYLRLDILRLSIIFPIQLLE